MLRKGNASRIYFLMSGMFALANAIMFTTYAVYYVNGLGLGPLELLLVGTALELTCFVFEVPTGVVADVYSRRLSIIIGLFIIGGAYVLEGSLPWLPHNGAIYLLPLFAGVVLAEMIRGVGETFVSGANAAWITDEVGEKNVGDVFMRATQIRQICSLVGIGASVGLAGIALNLPYMIGGVLYLLLAIILVFFMPETGFTPMPREERSNFQMMKDTFVDGVRVVRGNRVLMSILAVGVFAGAASEGFDRLWEAHFLKDFTFPSFGVLSPAVWFGIFSAMAMLLSIFVTGALRRRLDLGDQRKLTKLLLVFTALRIVLLAGFALTGYFTLAVILYLAFSMVTTLTWPIFATWLNANIDSRVRSTVLSMTSQTDAFGQMAGGPVVGAVGSRYTIRASLLMAAALLAPIVPVLLSSLRRSRGSVHAEQAVRTEG